MPFEILPESCELARETFRLAGVDQILEWIADDALTRHDTTNCDYQWVCGWIL